MNATNTTIVGKGFSFLDTVFSEITSKLVVAVIIVLIGFIFGKLVGKLIQSVLRNMEIDKILKKATGLRIPIEDTLGVFTSYFIYFVAIVMALNHIGLTTDILNIISAAVMIIIILSVFLGIKDFVPNAISGIILHQKGFLKEGDYIKVDNIKGKIEHLNLIETRIKTKSGDIINIPNSVLTKNKYTKKKSKSKKIKK